MPEVLVRGDDVADQLLEFLEVRETPLFLAGPKGFAVDPHLEHSAGAGLQGDLAEFGFEGCQEFLRHPRGAQQPTAARAVFDSHSWFGRPGNLVGSAILIME